MTEYVLGFCFDAKLVTVLLIRKTRPEWQASKLNGVGGKIKVGETPLQVMEREFREETGCDVELDWRQFGTLRGGGEAVTSRWLVHLFHSVNLICSPSFYFPIYDGPEGGTEVRIVDDVVSRGASESLRPLPNLRWLIPMALNHLRGDEVSLLDVREVESC